MTVISKDLNLVTFINVFTVDPGNQQRLVDLLVNVTQTSVRHALGFVSSSLHRSLDGRKVTMYAQWRTMEVLGVPVHDSIADPFGGSRPELPCVARCCGKAVR